MCLPKRKEEKADVTSNPKKEKNDDDSYISPKPMKSNIELPSLHYFSAYIYLV